MNFTFILFILFFISVPLTMTLVQGSLGIFIPLFLGILLLSWIIISAVFNKKLVTSEKFSQGYADLGEESGNFSKKDSVLKKILVSCALTVGFMTILLSICIVFFPSYIGRLTYGNLIEGFLYLIFIPLFGISYLIVNKKLK